MAQISEYAADRELVRKHLDAVSLPKPLSEVEREDFRNRIAKLLQQRNAVIVAHYYTEGVIQDLAEATGGFVGDSLEMARFGKESSADILVVAGVRFMGETAKILSPEKTVLMPTLQATCSLDIACPIDEFSAFCDQHPERTVVVYANTSAAVKARSDWVVTSSIALDVVDHLQAEGKKIIWAPDKHLGRYIQEQTDADILLWDAACIVHEEFRYRGLEDMRKLYPQAAVLAHPESPEAVLKLADFVGSTSQMIRAAQEIDNDTFIVATDKGIFHRMRQLVPEATFIAAPTAGSGGTCRSCAHCPWMAMNSLPRLYQSLHDLTQQVDVEPDLGRKAMIPLQRMLDFAVEHRLTVKGSA